MESDTNSLSFFFRYSAAMRIIRFIADDGRTLHGTDHHAGTATVLRGSITDGFTPTAERTHIRKLLAPITPTDIICIGRNYIPSEAASDDRREEDGGLAHRHQPDTTLEVFLKPSTALQHPDDPILIPNFNGLDPQLDCEGELAVIIGKTVRNISEDDVSACVFGYTIANDVTARVFQTSSGPPIWMRGKGFDSFCPLGPAIVTPDEIPNPQSLANRTLINGHVVREGNTRDMIRTVPQIIASLSRHMTLQAGVIVLTGAPHAMPHAKGLSPSDQIEVQIDRCGSLKSVCVALK